MPTLYTVIRRPLITEKGMGCLLYTSMFKKQLDEGLAGDNAGILLRGIAKEDVAVSYTHLTSAPPLG